MSATEYSLESDDPVLGDYDIDMRLAGDDILLSNGYVFEAQTRRYKGKFALPVVARSVCPDLEHNRVFFVDETGVSAYDLTNFHFIGRFDVPDTNIRRRLVRWGNDGLAWVANNKLVVVRTALVTMPSPLAQPLPVNAEINGLRPVSLPANDLLYDVGKNRLLVAVPGKSPAGYGNSITPVALQSGATGTPVFIGSEPECFGEAADHETLWVGIFNALRRVQISSLTPQEQFSLGNDKFAGPIFAREIKVMPATNDTIAVAQHYVSRTPDFAGVVLFDNGVRRPESVNDNRRFDPNSITWGTGSSLYGLHSLSSDYKFVRMATSSNGVSVIDGRASSIAALYAQIKFFEERVYGTDGDVINPETTENLGHYGDGGQSLCIDETLRRIYFVAGNQGVGGNSSGAILTVYNLDTFALIGTQNLSGVSGEVRKLIRWGADGLAFISFNRNNGDSRVWIFHSPLVNENPKLNIAINPIAVRETAGTNAATATLTRNINLQQALVVQIVTNRPTDIEVPSSITIPAGQSSVTFPIGVKNNNVADGTRLALMVGRAPNYAPATGRLTIYDDEARLLLTLSRNGFLESDGPQASIATLSRNTPTNVALRVLLSSSDRTEATMPAAVIIPAGAASVTFPVAAVNDDDFDGAQALTLTAYNTGYAPAHQAVTVYDDDVPALSLSLTRTTISEGDGPHATLLIVKRNAYFADAVTVNLQSTGADNIVLPATITFVAGQKSAFVWVAVNDDSDPHSDQNATITAAAARFVPSQTDLLIEDDD